mmetsp:Transcript_4367/g.12828  ORF Transcript_4367/g.12828 Transcript_4367/m.12828 type:complete len:237 (+) Transcript_4367:269-979(+)
MTDTAQAPAAFSSRWLFSKDQIKSAPSVKDNFTAEQEQEVRKFSCTFLTEIGQNLVHPASVLAINCAKVFLHRFYMMECTDLSNKERHKEIAATCIFVACKSEECLRPLKEFIWAWNYIDFDKTKKQNPFGRFTKSKSNGSFIFLLTLRTGMKDLMLKGSLGKLTSNRKNTRKCGKVSFLAKGICCTRFSMISSSIIRILMCSGLLASWITPRETRRPETWFFPPRGTSDSRSLAT